jgi:hypothetical protein
MASDYSRATFNTNTLPSPPGKINLGINMSSFRKFSSHEPFYRRGSANHEMKAETTAEELAVGIQPIDL